MAFLDKFNFDLRGPEAGPKLVLLHGLMGSWTNWRKIISAFEANFRILSYDQRGHGKSFRPEKGYAPEDFADDLKKILAELNWTKINLVGHSMGGRNALVFAAQNPGVIDRLVIEDIAPEGRPEQITNIEAMLNKVPTPFTDKRVAKETILAAYPNQILANYMYSNIAEVSPNLYDWRFSKAAVFQAVREARTTDRWPEWESLRMPTLLIRGEKSDELSREMFEEMLTRNPNVKGVEIASAAHWVHSDQPAAFIEALKNFFQF